APGRRTDASRDVRATHRAMSRCRDDMCAERSRPSRLGFAGHALNGEAARGAVGLWCRQGPRPTHDPILGVKRLKPSVPQPLLILLRTACGERLQEEHGYACPFVDLEDVVQRLEDVVQRARRRWRDDTESDRAVEVTSAAR